MGKLLGDGDLDWTDAVFMCIIVGLLFIIYQISLAPPLVVYRNNTVYENRTITITETEIVYVNQSIPVPFPVIEYKIIEVEVPVYINNTTTEIIEIPPPPPTPLKNFENMATLKKWIRADTTDDIDYAKRFTCMDFTLRTIENANEDGYRMIFVYWQGYKGDPDSYHAVCMAYVIEEAMYVAFEPQSDRVLWEWSSTEGG